MTEINLLPWRAMLRSENEKRRKFFLICAGILVLIWIAIHIALGLIKQGYDTTVANLQDQLTELTNQTQQENTNPAFLITEQINANQIELTRFFEVLQQTIQKTPLLSTIESKNNHLILTGNADSFSSLTQFVNSYNKKNKALPMTILSTKNNNDVTALEFRLQLVRSTSSFSDQEKNDNDDDV